MHVAFARAVYQETLTARFDQAGLLSPRHETNPCSDTYLHQCSLYVQFPSPCHRYIVTI